MRRKPGWSHTCGRVALELEEYGLTESSFIEFPDALLPGVGGFLIPEREGK